jgi:hypothetical protein
MFFVPTKNQNSRRDCACYPPVADLTHAHNRRFNGTNRRLEPYYSFYFLRLKQRALKKNGESAPGGFLSREAD